MSLNRRQFLKWSSSAPIIAATPLLLPSQSVLAKAHEPQEEFRQLKLNNLHTGEKSHLVYWEHGEYVIDALAEIYLLMRDHRENTIAPIDVRLLDQLNLVQQKLESQKEILLVSGYRSPTTNEKLRKSNHSVSRNSMHMKGKAMDFLIPGLNLRQVHKATLASSIGGVGYYSRSGFIHMDTGRKRRWNL
jgi:uncharacterized protein YcbK (DUF882 family)